MTGTPRPLTDAELDTALASLAVPVEVQADDLAALRDRVLGTRPGRRRRRIVVTGAALAALSLGGLGAAAAGGLFDGQADEAYSYDSTHLYADGYTVDQSTVQQHITATTPDGGSSSIYTARGTQDSTGDDAFCVTMFTTDPGARPEGKPYRPQAGCNAGGGPDSYWTRAGQDSWSWQSARDGSYWSVDYGHTDPAYPGAVSVTFTAPDGDAITAPVEDDWYLVYIPIPDPQQPHTGMSLTFADGTTQVLSDPTGPLPG